MTALTLTAQPSTSSVLLSITGAPAGAVSITRTDSNGTNVVRLRAGQEPSGGTLILVDYEPALTGTLRYEVTDTASVTTVTTMAGGLALTGTVIGSVYLPQYAVVVSQITGYEADRAAGTIVHEVIDRPDWLLTFGPTRDRRGMLTVHCPTYAAARDLDSLCARLGEPLQLRQPTHPGLDMYFAPTSSRIVPAEEGAASWNVEIVYVEMSWPSGVLLGAAGWVVSSVAAWGTCLKVRTDFATCAALVAGP